MVENTECYCGSCTSAAALSARFPSIRSYGYESQSKHALRTTAEAPESAIPVRFPG